MIFHSCFQKLAGGLTWLGGTSNESHFNVSRWFEFEAQKEKFRIIWVICGLGVKSRKQCLINDLAPLRGPRSIRQSTELRKLRFTDSTRSRFSTKIKSNQIKSTCGMEFIIISFRKDCWDRHKVTEKICSVNILDRIKSNFRVEQEVSAKKSKIFLRFEFFWLTNCGRGRNWEF